MSLKNPYETYQQNSVNTASPGELTLMLYEGCIKFIKRGKKALEEKNYQEKNNNIIKAQNIIREFMVTLDMQYAISQELMIMYEYMLHRLIEANINNDIEILDEVEELVVGYRDTWKEVIKINRKIQFGSRD